MPKEYMSVNMLQNEIKKLTNVNQLILDSVAEGIYGIDLNAKVIFWNKAAEQLTGYVISDFESENLHDLIHHTNDKGEHVPLCDCPVYHALNNGKSIFVEDDIFWHKDGTSFPVEYTVNPMMENEKHVGTVITFRDVTEKKKTEKILQEWEKLSLVGQMSAGIAHELRNPITSLKGFTQLMRYNKEPKEEYFEIMDNEFDRMELIIQELLTFSKPQKRNYKNHNISQLIEQVVLLMEPQATMKNTKLLYESECTSLEITCIADQMKQVLINLIKNALEAIETNGTVSVRLSQHNNIAVIQIADDGSGMSNKQIEKLGEPFFSTKEKGTGLGMMVTKNIIKNHHQGNIHVESKLSVGTTFTIELPVKLQL
ncbi:MAG: PAS domain S-box protein [Bacillaceae bacterium]|nr:PAS domain S-box protein [Bacillaceae bacterium]